MFIERRIDQKTQVVELWECEWVSNGKAAPQKIFLKKIGIEEPVDPEGDDGWVKANAIVWANDRSLGNFDALTIRNQ